MELAFKGLGRQLGTLQSTSAGQGPRKGFGVGVLEEVQESEAEVEGRVSAVEGTTGKAWRPESTFTDGDVAGGAGQRACRAFRRAPLYCEGTREPWERSEQERALVIPGGQKVPPRIAMVGLG